MQFEENKFDWVYTDTCLNTECHSKKHIYRVWSRYKGEQHPVPYKKGDSVTINGISYTICCVFDISQKGGGPEDNMYYYLIYATYPTNIGIETMSKEEWEDLYSQVELDR